MKLARQLKDYRLTTAEILYRLPDHPALLQTYIWQELDLAPRYPCLRSASSWISGTGNWMARCTPSAWPPPG